MHVYQLWRVVKVRRDARCYVPWKFTERNPLFTLRTVKICMQRNPKSNTKLNPNLNFNSNRKTNLNPKTNRNLNLQNLKKTLKK